MTRAEIIALVAAGDDITRKSQSTCSDSRNGQCKASTAQMITATRSQTHVENGPVFLVDV